MFYDPEDGWRGVVGLLISGLGHDLNGRLTALMGIAHVARHAGADRELLDVLDEQVRRLEQSIRALRAWPVDSARGPVLTRVKDLLPPVVELYGCRGGGDDPRVTVEDGASNAVRLRTRPFMEAVLLLLAAAEHGDSGRHRPLVLRYGSEGGESWLTIEGSGPQVEGAGDNRSVMEARGLIEQAGGRLVDAGASDGAVRYEVRVPEAV